MRVSDDQIHFHAIVPPSQSGQNEDIVRFVRGDGSVTILGVPFDHAASARIDVGLKAFKAGMYPRELPEEAVSDAIIALHKQKKIGWSR